MVHWVGRKGAETKRKKGQHRNPRSEGAQGRRVSTRRAESNKSAGGEPRWAKTKGKGEKWKGPSSRKKGREKKEVCLCVGSPDRKKKVVKRGKINGGKKKKKECPSFGQKNGK